MSSSSLVYVVVGASKGIGFETVKQLSSISSNIVYAGIRSPTPTQDLLSLSSSRSNIHIISTDLSSSSSISSAAEKLAKEVNGIDVLIVNGAQIIMGRAIEGNTEALETLLNVNVLGAFRSINSFLPLLRKRETKKIVVIGSTGGSKTLTPQLAPLLPTGALYNVTKGALNSIVVQFATELKPEGFKVISICPGAVPTETQQRVVATYPPESAELLKAHLISVDESVKRVLIVTDSLSSSQNGAYLNNKGEPIPW